MLKVLTQGVSDIGAKAEDFRPFFDEMFLIHLRRMQRGRSNGLKTTVSAAEAVLPDVAAVDLPTLVDPIAGAASARDPSGAAPAAAPPASAPAAAAAPARALEDIALPPADALPPLARKRFAPGSSADLAPAPKVDVSGFPELLPDPDAGVQAPPEVVSSRAVAEQPRAVAPARVVQPTPVDRGTPGAWPTVEASLLDEPEPGEPAKVVEPAKVESAKLEPSKLEPAKLEPAKLEPAKAAAVRVERASAEAAVVPPAVPVASVEGTRRARSEPAVAPDRASQSASELKLRRLIDSTSLDDVPRRPVRSEIPAEQFGTELAPGQWLELISSTRKRILAKVAWINDRHSVVLLLQHPDRLILSRHVAALIDRAARKRAFRIQ